MQHFSGLQCCSDKPVYKLDKVTVNSVDYWDIDTPADLLWLTDTLNLDADSDGTADFDSTAEKWAANYRLAADITFDPDSSKVDWNFDGTVDFARQYFSVCSGKKRPFSNCR